MLMVAEMTGSLSILGPAMIAVGLAWFIVRRSDDTIYRSQLGSRADAPAQRILIGMPLLAGVPVRLAMAPPRLVVDGGWTASKSACQLVEQGLEGAPVVDGEGRFEGVVSLSTLRAATSGEGRTVEAFIDGAASTVHESAHLDVAVEALAIATRHWVPVLDDDRMVVGTVSTSDVVRGYRLGLLASLRRLTRDGGGDDPDQIRIAPGSWLAGRPLRQAELPPSVIVTTIQRGRDLVVPGGDTVLAPQDELVLIGTRSDIAAVGHLAATHSVRPEPDDSGTTGAADQGSIVDAPVAVDQPTDRHAPYRR
jgi:CBS domain-containing protein